MNEAQKEIVDRTFTEVAVLDALRKQKEKVLNEIEKCIDHAVTGCDLHEADAFEQLKEVVEKL